MDETQLAEAQNKEYRHGLVSAQIDIDLPLQIRALRKQRGLTQPELAELTGMKQPRFPLMEKPGGAKFTLETLRRLAEAFDIALIVRFAPFSELLDWSEHFNPDSFAVPSFQSEIDSGAFADTGSNLTPSSITCQIASYGEFLANFRNAMTMRSLEPKVNDVAGTGTLFNWRFRHFSGRSSIMAECRTMISTRRYWTFGSRGGWIGSILT